MARLTVPFAREKTFDFQPKRHRRQGGGPVAPARARSFAACTDAEFLRRAMLDTIGTTPTPDEVEDFIADQDPDKRVKLVDRMLDGPEYVDYWTLKWGDVLRVNSEKLGARGCSRSISGFAKRFAANKPVTGWSTSW